MDKRSIFYLAKNKYLFVLLFSCYGDNSNKMAVVMLSWFRKNTIYVEGTVLLFCLYKNA